MKPNLDRIMTVITWKSYVYVLDASQVVSLGKAKNISERMIDESRKEASKHTYVAGKHH